MIDERLDFTNLFYNIHHYFSFYIDELSRRKRVIYAIIIMRWKNLNLENKIVIVTGGTRGIGLEIVRAFYEQKAHVILFGSKKETVDKAVEILKKEGKNVEGYYPNLNHYKEVEEIVDNIYEQYGHIDILINNAGISQHEKIDDITSEDFSKVMNINVNAMFHVSKAVIPYMKEQRNGVILNTSSMVSIYGQPSGVGYPTSKFAVNGFTRSLARELAPFHIRVNAVAPGIIQTEMVSSLPKEMIEPLLKTIPLGRIGEPRDVANAFLFLASDLASYITGVVLQVDGAATN